MSTLNVAIAVEGVGWNSPDYYPMLVMQSIFGNWDRSLGASPLLSSRLSHIIQSNNLANSFMSFSTSYSDTGLWGIYMVSENLTNVDDLVHFTLKEWRRMSTGPMEAEVERAKAQLKASLLLGLDGTTAIAEDIGRQLITSGKRLSPKEIEVAVDSVSVNDIQRVAQKYLWDKDIAMAAVGPTDGCVQSHLLTRSASAKHVLLSFSLLDYNRIRNDMSTLLCASFEALQLITTKTDNCLSSPPLQTKWAIPQDERPQNLESRILTHLFCS
jgi:processing peptidase subunit beta